MDSLSKYIFDHYSNLMTRPESMARTYFLLKQKAESGSKINTTSIDNYLFIPEVAELINLGEEEFYVTVKNRLLKEHTDEIFLNYCPKCGNLTRTPKARLCLKCKYKWHDQK